MQYSNFGKFLRKKRESLNPRISLNKFAIESGIEPAVLSRIETQKQGISLNVLSQIANGYKMSVSELVAEYEKIILKQ